MNKRITTALAATMVCALTLGLAGCEGQVPQTVAPSVKDNEIIDVTVAQEKQIRGKILDVLNQANEAKSADGLAARVSGSQLEIRTAQLNIAQYTQQDVTPLATIPSDVTQVVIPTDNAWPRYIFTVTTTTEDQQAKRLLVMRQESARQNYKLWAVARLLEDVSLPGFAPAKQGNVMGDANDSNLVMTPKQAVQRYADVLQNVSSWHHQAVKSVEGTGLTVTAKTTLNGVDIIEAVENKDKTFCVGVQFHPENDCSLVLYQGKEAPCDFDTCLAFFENLVAYASEKPVIGISWGGDPVDYTDIQDIIREAGGVVTHLPQITRYEQAVSALKSVDGIVVTGGEDINPDLYGDEHSPLLEDNTEYRDIRDTSDYNLIQAAVQTDEPMLAICRGMQMLNVVCGGGLIQDLPTYLGKDDSYRVHRNKPDWARHDITVTDTDSLLHSIVGGTSLANVASWHHQVANPQRVGQGLTVVAYGPDEVIEALEYQANDFTLGVQFHPEADALDHDAYMDFFEALLAHTA